MAKKEIKNVKQPSRSICLDALDAKGEVIALKKARRQFEKQFIVLVLEKLGWNQTRAAKAMGIHRNTLIGKLSELSIRRN